MQSDNLKRCIILSLFIFTRLGSWTQGNTCQAITRRRQLVKIWCLKRLPYTINFDSSYCFMIRLHDSEDKCKYALCLMDKKPAYMISYQYFICKLCTVSIGKLYRPSYMNGLIKAILVLTSYYAIFKVSFSCFFSGSIIRHTLFFIFPFSCIVYLSNF